jgi:hypothetical protein
MRSYSLSSLLLISVHSVYVADNTCNEVCTTGSGRLSSSLGGCDCCYENLAVEPLTARDWANYSGLAVDETRHEWFRKRLPFEPIVGDDTLIAGVLYTLSKSTLKMTVMFPPLHPSESRTAVVVVVGSKLGNTIVRLCNVKEHTWHCLIRIDDLPQSEAYSFHVEYKPNMDVSSVLYTYEGVIPKQEGYPRIAAMGCFGMDSTRDKSELVNAVAAESADMLILQGDQTYFGANLGYGFLELVYSLRSLTRSMPTIVQMDDHDYGEGNIWGAGDWEDDTSGAGFGQPPCYVNAIQDLAMGHLPDAATQETLLNGISIYYTNYIYGSVDFAILEARKFKNHKAYDSLLGDDQELWLQGWCNNTSSEQRLHIVLTQTPFAALATNNTIPTKYNKAGMVSAGTPIDSNGYPASGRTRFMEIVKNCAPLVLSGDQHLGIAVSYDDYTVSECASPAAINDVYWRLNLNPVGEAYHDPFGNQFRLLGAWNVDESVWKNINSPDNTKQASDLVKKSRADGFMMVNLDGETATCEMHSYRVSHELVWKVDIPAVSPLSAASGFCFSACHDPLGKDWVCERVLACSACDAEQVCPSLCLNCPAGSSYGDLSCTC